MSDLTTNEPAPFIPFYSFKGGVGFSMALVNESAIGRHGVWAILSDAHPDDTP